MNSNTRPGLLLGAGALALLLGCTQKNPVYCQTDLDCTDGLLPVCDEALRRCVVTSGNTPSDDEYEISLHVGATSCADTDAGDATRPYCKIQDALKDTRARTGAISIAAGTYAEDLVLDADAILVGQPGARIQTQSCPGIRIYDKARVVLSSLEVVGKGGIRVYDRAIASLRKLDLRSTPCLGVDCQEASCELRRNRIVSNALGGIALSATKFTVVNNLIAGNGSVGEFGGVRISDPQSGSSFDNNTVVDNETPEDVPGGVVCQAAFEIRNSILWQNGSDDDDGPSDVSGSCTLRFCDVSQSLSSLTGTGNLSADPQFEHAESGDYRLRPESPCVDRGEAEGAPTEDLDGNPRPRGSGVDIGAHEAG